MTITFLAVIQVHGAASIEEARGSFAEQIAEISDLTLRSAWDVSNAQQGSDALNRAAVVLGDVAISRKSNAGLPMDVPA